MGKIETLESSIESSKPLDEIAELAKNAMASAESWQKISDVQTTREAIANDLKPLKDLQNLVDCETDRTIKGLSKRVTKLLYDIHINERFNFADATLSKKSVSILGGFQKSMKIDATLVANKSWLRAMLWAFVFAIREMAISEKGHNEFPLMVLDDPQTTFDPQNLRKWTRKIVELANLDKLKENGTQLFLTTHEKRFYDLVCQESDFSGQKGKIVGPSSTCKVAQIVSGMILERLFEKAAKSGDGEDSRFYIQQMRVYCENLLKIMLRSESSDTQVNGLGKLCNRMSDLGSLNVAPYNRPSIRKLIRVLDNKASKECKEFRKRLDEASHIVDCTIGLAQAKDVKTYWEKTVEPAFVKALRMVADYDAYGSVTRLIDWRESVIDFPNGNEEQVGTLKFHRTEYAAAAESDGIGVGSGQIAIQESDDQLPVSLFKHSAYRLNVSTLSPVAEMGDVILVQNFKKPVSGNLVVGIYGDMLYARRLNETKDDSEFVVLTGQAIDPYSIPEPIVAPKDKTDLRKIIGTVFLRDIILPHSNGHEISEIDTFGLIEDRLRNVKLLQVKGRSMEPIALDEQYLITKDENLELPTVKKLNGHLVIASDDEDRIYFKRLRLHNGLIVLESTNSSWSTSSEILSFSEGAEFPKLTSLRSVVGVLFDLPTSD